MSRVYWHSPTRDVELSGRERHNASAIVNGVALSFLPRSDFDSSDRHAISACLPAGHYLHSIREDRPDAWWDAFRTWITAGMDDAVLMLPEPHGRTDLWTVCLNTAMAIGGRPLKLLARLYAQCEIHAYVEGPNRRWLAGIIREGRASGLYREDMGWERVIELLDARDDEPVVMSYSVTDQFPNPYDLPEFGGWSDEQRDAWYEWPAERKWAEAMAALRARPGNLELKPDNFDDYFFNRNLKMWDVMRLVREARPAGAVTR